MGQISDLESRINSALDRITAGMDGLQPPAPPVDLTELARLQTELSRQQSELDVAQLEKTAALDKIDDLLTAHDRQMSEHAVQMSEHAVQIEAQKTQIQDMDEILQRLRHANAQLRDNNQALRQANQDGVGDPQLVNTSMLAELEGLRATQAADKAEADAIIGALRPLLRAAPDN